MKPAAWKVVLLSAWQARRNAGAVWPIIFVAIWMPLVLPVVMALVADGPQRRRPMLVLAMCIAVVPLTSLWTMLTANLMLQNHPHHAALVPGHRRTIRLALVAGWLFTSTIAGAGVGLALGHTLVWMLVMGMVLLVGAASAHRPGVWLPLLLLMDLVLWSWHRWHGPGLAELVATVESAPGVAAATFALLGACALLPMLGDGGSAHQRRYERRRGWFAISGIGMSAGARGQPGVDLPSWTQWPYQAWLAVRLRRPGSVMSRLALGLGMQAHWSTHLGILARAALLVTVYLGIARLLSGAGSRVPALALLPIAAALAARCAAQTLAALQASKREQAVLMTLPGVPRDTALNRALAWHLARQHLLVLGLGCVLAWWWGDLKPPAPIEAIGFGPSVCAVVAALFIGLLLWRDWSRQNQQSTRLGRLFASFAVVIIGAGILWILVGRWAPWTSGISALVLLAALAAWRWRRMMQAPQALPAGRLA